MFKQLTKEQTFLFSGLFGKLDAAAEISPFIPLMGCFSFIELCSLGEVGMEVASAMGGDVRW